MTPLSRDQLEALLHTPDETCLSIYLPTERKGAETQQNAIRFKNLVRDAERQLEEQGLERPEVEALIEPLRRVVDDHDFWQHQEDGLAVFRSPDRLETHLLPVRFSELAVVNDHFYLKPLFALFRGDGRFHILALSLHDVRLFSASRWSVEEIELGSEVPKSLSEVVGGEVEESHIQFHGVTGRTTKGSGGSPIYHGQGGGVDDTKPEITRFFHRVDRALGAYLRDRNAPVVLAGVEYLLPLYREASGLPHVLEEGIPGNPEKLRPEQLHERAWELVRPVLVARREKDAERFRELAAAGRASSSLDEVVPAAFDGRVETLFISAGERLLGRFDERTREVELAGGSSRLGASRDGAKSESASAETQDDADARDGEDLLDLAAVQTFLNGGTVYALEGERLPEGSRPVAAIFRY